MGILENDVAVVVSFGFRSLAANIGGILMLAVLSDLHFQDTKNDIIPGDCRDAGATDRNVSSKAFSFIFDELIDIADKVKARELHIVLAGDIFDLNRSRTWFEGPVRPYGEHQAAEWLPVAKRILDDIVESNKMTFSLFSQLSERKLANGAPVVVSYLPGNHDRLINLHPGLRRQVRKLFGMQDEEASFPHELVLTEYGVHVRHGHEYDRTNFAGRIAANGPLSFDPRDYDRAPMGDFVTIDIVGRIAHEFRTRYAKELQAGDLTICMFYRKLLEFDDLRPTSDLISFMKTETADGDGALQRYFLPVVDEVLGKALKNEFLVDWLGRWTVMKAKVLKWLSTEALLDRITRMDSEPQRPWEFALREPDLIGDNSPFRYLVAGHTHAPDVVFLRRSAKGRERFYIDTGTWRQQIRKCKDQATFARAKALTYALFYSPEKDNVEDKRVGRFDYWNGYTKTVMM